MDQRRNVAVADRVARRGRTRPAIAALVIVLWLGGLALLARRELLKPLSAKLAEAALEVQPASHYYVIERGGRIVGGASSEIDTTAYGVLARQQLFGFLLAGDSTETIVRARSTYTPRLSFGSIKIELERGTDSLALSANRMGDTLIAVSVDGANIPAQRVASSDPVFLPPLAAMPLAMIDGPKRGEQSVVGVFDPITRRVRALPLRLAAESVFVVVDSAMFDPDRQRWTMARRDTVRAWLVTSDSTPMRAWVDRTGQIVEFHDGRGTSLRRTAYEIAFENWRIERGRRAPMPPAVPIHAPTN